MTPGSNFSLPIAIAPMVLISFPQFIPMWQPLAPQRAPGETLCPLGQRGEGCHGGAASFSRLPSAKGSEEQAFGDVPRNRRDGKGLGSLVLPLNRSLVGLPQTSRQIFGTRLQGCRVNSWTTILCHVLFTQRLCRGDLAGTMGNRARFSKLFLQFSGGKNHWTGEDMSNFCSAIWKQDGSAAIVGAWGRGWFDFSQGTCQCWHWSG